jgi:hypothetical protein
VPARRAIVMAGRREPVRAEKLDSLDAATTSATMRHSPGVDSCGGAACAASWTRARTQSMLPSSCRMHWRKGRHTGYRRFFGPIADPRYIPLSFHEARDFRHQDSSLDDVTVAASKASAASSIAADTLFRLGASDNPQTPTVVSTALDLRQTSDRRSSRKQTAATAN